MDEGWDVPEPMATLVLDRAPYAGGEIEMRLGLSPLVYFGVEHWLSTVPPDASIATQITAATELGKLFAEHGLASWNLRWAKGPHKGELMPATEAGVLALDWKLILKIAAEWWGLVGTVALPLPDASAEAPSPPRLSERLSRSTPGGPDTVSPPPQSTPTFPDSSGSGS